MIKKWDKFLEGKERVVQLDMFNKYIPKPEIRYENLWTISPDEIEDILIEFEDADFIIDIEKGFINKEGRFGKVIIEYTDIPSFGITISTGSDTIDENFTSSLKTAIKRLHSYFETITLHDNISTIKLDDIRINKGCIYMETEEEELDIDGSLFIKCQGHPITITDKHIIDYYKLSTSNTVIFQNELAQIEFEVSKLADLLLELNDGLKYLRGTKEMNINLYTPETADILYSLTKDTLIRLFKYSYYHDVAAFDEFKTSEEFIDYVNKNLINLKIITELLDKSPFIDKIKSLYKDLDEEKQIEQNYKTLIRDFIKIVEESLSTKVVDTYNRGEKLRLLVNFNLNWFKPDAWRNHRWTSNRVDIEDIEGQHFINILSDFGWDAEESLQTRFEEVSLSKEEFSEAVNRIIIKDSKKT